MRILGCALLSAGLTTGFIQTRLPLIRHNHNKSSSCHTSFTPPLSSSRSRLAYSANDYLDNLPKFVSDEKPLGSFATDTYLNTLSQFTDPASASVAIYKPEEYLQNLCSTFIENNNGVASSVSERIEELSKLSAQGNSINVLSGFASDSPSIQSPDFSNLKQDLSESLESIKSEITIFANQGNSGNDRDSAPNTINDSQSTIDSMNTVIASNSDEQISTSSNPTDTFEASTVSDNQPYLSENSVSNTESIPSNDVSESVSVANDGESTFVSNSIDDSIIDSSVGFDQSLPFEPSVPESMPETPINSVLTSDTLEQSNINNYENVDVSEFAGLPEEKPTLFDTTDPVTKTFFNDMFDDASSPETIIASDNTQVIDQSASSTYIGNSLASTSNDVPDFSNTVSEQPSLAYIVDSTENVLSSSNNNNFEGIVDNNDFTDSFSTQNSIGESEYIPENSFEQSTFETDVFKDTSAFASNNGETEQAQTSFENSFDFSSDNFDTPEPVNTFSEVYETTTDTSYSTNTEGFDDSKTFASNNIEMQPSTYEETSDFSNNFGISESESAQDSIYAAENNLGQPTLFEESTTFNDISNSFYSSDIDTSEGSTSTLYESASTPSSNAFEGEAPFGSNNIKVEQASYGETNTFSNSFSSQEYDNNVQSSMDTVYATENRFEQSTTEPDTVFQSSFDEIEQANYESSADFSNGFSTSGGENTQDNTNTVYESASTSASSTDGLSDSTSFTSSDIDTFSVDNMNGVSNSFSAPESENTQETIDSTYSSVSAPTSSSPEVFEDTTSFASEPVDLEQYSSPEPLADLTEYSSESNNNMVTHSAEGFVQSESYSADTTITSNSLQSNEASAMNMNDPIASVAEPSYVAPSSTVLEQSSIADIVTNSPSNSDVIETAESISAPLDLTSQLSELSNSYDKMMSNDQFAPRGNMAFLPPTEKIEQIKLPELSNIASGISEKIAKAFQSGSIDFMEANNNYNNRGFAGLVESGQASVSNSVNQISESSLSDLANGFLFGLEAMGMALYDIIGKFLDEFAGTSFATVLESAQVSLENILNGAYGVVDDAFQSFYSLGDVTLKEVAIAVVTIISTVAKLLFSILSAVVQVVSGQSIQEWAVTASKAVEYEANEVVSIANAALNDLSHQTLSELGNMVGHFSYDVANLMVESVNTASGMVS